MTQPTTPRRTLIFLVLNEIDGVRAIIPKIPENVADERLAVDGGSQDGTAEWLREKGIRVLTQERRGRGEAFRVGVAASQGQTIVFFSPDGNENPTDIASLFQAVEEGADLCIASRFLRGSRNEEDHVFFAWRKWANQAFTWASNRLWNNGAYVTDTINGFRAIRRSAFEKMALTSMNFTIEYEMTMRAMRLNLRIREIPTAEGQRVGGVTKAPSIKTGLRFLGFLLKNIGH